MKRLILPAAIAALAIGIASSSMAQVTIGDNARVTARGAVCSQLTVTLGPSSPNAVGGITEAGPIAIDPNAVISTAGAANSQVKLGNQANASCGTIMFDRHPSKPVTGEVGLP